MILASHSPRRLELLQLLGAHPRVMAANIDERKLPGEYPMSYVERLAQSKAEAAAALAGGLDGNEVLIAADTIVYLDEIHIFGKPKDHDDAARMLTELSGKTHRVTTGVCILKAAAEAPAVAPTEAPVAISTVAPHKAASAPTLLRSVFTETTEVEFYPLSKREIDAYLRTTDVYDFAGAYAIQGSGALLVKAIHGDYLNVVGLPVSHLLRELAKLRHVTEPLVEPNELLR